MEHFYDEDDDVNDMYWQPRSRNDIGQPQQPRFEHAADIGVPVPSGSDVYGRGAPRPSNLLPHASVMESLLSEPEHVAEGGVAAEAQQQHGSMRVAHAGQPAHAP